MKKLLLIILSFISISCNAQTFNGIWGTTLRQNQEETANKLSENQKLKILYKTTKAIRCEGSFAGYEATGMFLFLDSMLYLAAVEIKCPIKESNDYMIKIAEEIKEKYGVYLKEKYECNWYLKGTNKHDVTLTVIDMMDHISVVASDNFLSIVANNKDKEEKQKDY